MICNYSILKAVRLDDCTVGVANQLYVTFVDLRNNAKTNNFKVNKEVRTVCKLNQHTLFYGCQDGEVGVFDRTMDKYLWSTRSGHKHRVYSICRVG